MFIIGGGTIGARGAMAPQIWQCQDNYNVNKNKNTKFMYQKII